MILAAGADVNSSDSQGVTVLQGAATSGNLALVVDLLKKRANVDLCDVDGIGPLYRAANKGYDEIVKALVEAGANPNMKEKLQSFTPLHTASINGYPKDINNAQPLHHACQEGYTEVIELLLGACASVHTLDGRGRSPLVLAASVGGHAKAVSLLIDAGANPNELNAYGCSVLFGVSKLEVLKVLASRGTSATALDVHGQSPLHYAAILGFDIGVICFLYKMGVVPTIKNRSGKTAADAAREAGHEDAAKMIDLLIAKHQSSA